MKSKKLLSLVATMLFASALIPKSVQASTVQYEQVKTIQSEVNSNSRIIITPDKNKDKVIHFTSSPAKVETKYVECEVGGTITIFDETSGFIFKVTNVGNKSFRTIYQYGAGFFSFIFYLEPGSKIQTTAPFTEMSFLHPETLKPVERFAINYDYKNMKNIINEVNVFVE